MDDNQGQEADEESEGTPTPCSSEALLLPEDTDLGQIYGDPPHNSNDYYVPTFTCPQETSHVGSSNTNMLEHPNPGIPLLLTDAISIMSDPSTGTGSSSSSLWYKFEVPEDPEEDSFLPKSASTSSVPVLPNGQMVAPGNTDLHGDFVQDNDFAYNLDLLQVISVSSPWPDLMPEQTQPIELEPHQPASICSQVAPSSKKSDSVTSVSTSTDGLIKVLETGVTTSDSNQLSSSYTSFDNNNNEADVVGRNGYSLWPSKKDKKMVSIGRELVLVVPPPALIVYRTEKQISKNANKKRILVVENNDEESKLREQFEHNLRALGKRMRRDNVEALQVIRRIQSSPTSEVSMDDFSARERFYRRKHLVAWQAANSMPRTKKIPFETEIPLAATTYLKSSLPKCERVRRLIIKVFGCGYSHYYVNELLTQLSVDQFNAKYNNLKTVDVLPGFGLIQRMKIFMKENPKVLERDEIMTYTYRDYLENRHSIQA